MTQSKQFSAGQKRVQCERPVSPAAHFYNRIIQRAHQLKATDIHLNLSEANYSRSESIQLRLRVDGQLLDQRELVESELLARPVSAREVLLHIQEQVGVKTGPVEQPQIGRAELECEGSRLDIRAEFLCLGYGESLVFHRILGGRTQPVPLEEMMDPYLQELLPDPLQGGLTLLCGVSGVGKTTLIEKLVEGRLQERVAFSVSRIEELKEPGLQHLTVFSHKNITHNQLLRAAYRADPDLILLDDMHEERVARGAAQMAMSGCSVIAEMAVRGAAKAITQLSALGCRPAEISGSFTCALELVRIPLQAGGRRTLCGLLLPEDLPPLRNEMRPAEMERLLEERLEQAGRNVLAHARRLWGAGELTEQDLATLL